MFLIHHNIFSKPVYKNVFVPRHWRSVDDVTFIHFSRLKGHDWPTTGDTGTQRGTSLLPFPRGLGVTVVYKERFPTGTLHPQSPSTPTILPTDSPGRPQHSHGNSCWQDRGECVKRCERRDFGRSKKWVLKVGRTGDTKLLCYQHIFCIKPEKIHIYGYFM